jgi:hypothetical protein
LLSDSGMCFVRYCYLKNIIFFYLFHQLLGQNSQFTIRLTVIYDTRRRDERHFISINVNVNYQLIAKHMTGLRNYVFCDWNPGYVVFIKGIAQICLNFQFHSYIRFLFTYALLLLKFVNLKYYCRVNWWLFRRAVWRDISWKYPQLSRRYISIRVSCMYLVRNSKNVTNSQIRLFGASWINRP